LRGLGATSWSVVTVDRPEAVATATVIRVVARSSQEQGDRPRRKHRSQKSLHVARGDRAGDGGRAHGGG
jgi:hypothetical protein